MKTFKIHSEVAWRENDRLRLGQVLSTTNHGHVELKTDSEDVITKMAPDLVELTDAHKREFLAARYPEAKMPDGDTPVTEPVPTIASAEIALPPDATVQPSEPVPVESPVANKPKK